MKTKFLRLVFSLLAGALVAASAWGFAYITDHRAEGVPLPIKWPPGSIPIQIKLGSAATLTDGTNFSTSAQGAAQAWNPLLGNVQFVPQIVAEGPAGDHNNVNELVFANTVFGQAFDNNVLAITTSWVTDGNERTEGDIIFNRARTWNSYDGPTQGSTVDLQRVALHELGHLLGLDHPDEAGQSFTAPLPIMNSLITGNDRLTADDIIGVQNLYGPPGVPANDNFANATTLTLTGNTATVTGYNTNATKQTGEPNHVDNAGGHSIWWRWTAPSAGAVTIDTRGSYTDTTLAVYTGTAVNSLTAIASNDDIDTGKTQASRVIFNAALGTTYFIAVDGWDGESAGITLHLVHTPGQTLPVITTQPVSTSVTAGGTMSFTVVATNATGYQWTFNGTNISGATSATYTLNNVQVGNGGTYRVAVSNGVGSVNSDQVTLTVNPAPVPVTPPSSGGGGGGGGGGGAPGFWFYGALGVLCLARFLRRLR